MLLILFYTLTIKYFIKPNLKFYFANCFVCRNAKLFIIIFFCLGRYNAGAGYVPPHLRNQGMGRGGPPVPMQGMPPSYGGAPMTGPNGGMQTLSPNF